MRRIACVTMDLTTHCDQRCPDCCAGVGINRVLQHHPWEYFERVAPFIYGIERVNLTGGEPTLHPRFAEYALKFRDLFGCKRLTLSTNGWGQMHFPNTIKKAFDEVHFSDYHLDRAIDHPKLFTFDGGVNGGSFVARSRRGAGGPCFRGHSDTVAYADGKFFPCCVSPGLDGTQGIEPCEDWREKVQQIDMGCGNCMFSPETH